MKKGISLIVLVITIIVMIIIAGAIIMSLNNSKLIENANNAVLKSNEAEATSLLSIKYAEILHDHYVTNPTVTYQPNAADTVILNAYVKQHTNNDFGVDLTNGEYVIRNDHQTSTGSNG